MGNRQHLRAFCRAPQLHRARTEGRAGMTADSEKDIQALKAIGRLCAETLRKMMHSVRAGLTTGELDAIGRQLLESQGAHSAPEITYHYPGATCISVAPVIAHGIPGDYVLKEKDLIHIDVSAELDGYFADTGASLWVTKGKWSSSARAAPEIRKLIEATKASLARALNAARAGNPLNEIGRM